jgi:hypothetical protein
LLNGALARATSIGPPVASIDSGAKSFTGSYGSFGIRMALFTCVSGSVINTVCPSAGALATKSAAMMPLAPALASITTGWLQRCWSFSP